jgi:hypothetical protein
LARLSAAKATASVISAIKPLSRIAVVLDREMQGRAVLASMRMPGEFRQCSGEVGIKRTAGQEIALGCGREFSNRRDMITAKGAANGVKESMMYSPQFCTIGPDKPATFS